MGIHKLSTGHCKMQLPFKRENTVFENNEYQALIRHNQLKRRLVKKSHQSVVCRFQLEPETLVRDIETMFISFI